MFLWLKAVNEITARQWANTNWRHKKCVAYNILTTQIELAVPINLQVLDRSQNYRIFNVRTIF